MRINLEILKSWQRLPIDEEDMIWWSPLWALFDEESWQSSYWPWSCQSDRVISLFWKQATRSFLTGSSHQRSLKSELGIVNPAEGLLLKIGQMKLVLGCAWKISKGEHIFSLSCWSAATVRSPSSRVSDEKGLESAWKIPKSASVGVHTMWQGNA